MSRQSVKPAKRSAKSLLSKSSVKKGAKAGIKSIAKSARAAKGGKSAKAAAKSARSPVGKSTIVAPSAKTVAKMIRTASPPMQPFAGQDIVLKSHKYQVGETVYFTSPTFGRAAATGSYTVVKLLPSEGDDYQYRIKSSGEAFERVAKESQLEKM